MAWHKTYKRYFSSRPQDNKVEVLCRHQRSERSDQDAGIEILI